MRPFAFAWRSLSHQPARALLGVTGMAVVGALLFDMLLLSRGLLVSFGELLESTGFDIRVTATESLPGLGPPIADAGAAVESLRRLPEIAHVVPVRFGSVRVEAKGGRTAEVGLMGGEARHRGEWQLVRGQDLSYEAPGATPDMVINRVLSERLGLEPGATLRVVSVLPAQEFRVVGLVEFPFEAVAEPAAATTLSAFARAVAGAAADEADLLLVASATGQATEATLAAVHRARPDLHGFSNAEVLERLRQAEFSYFRQISFVLSVISAFFALLLVATLLTVSVNQRLGEVAALRALGFSRRRIIADLLAEAALVVGGGGILAVPLGLALARALDAILRQLPELPARLHFFVFEPWVLVVHAAFLALATLLAAAYPVVLAARLPITTTLRAESVS